MEMLRLIEWEGSIMAGIRRISSLCIVGHHPGVELLANQLGCLAAQHATALVAASTSTRQCNQSVRFLRHSRFSNNDNKITFLLSTPHKRRSGAVLISGAVEILHALLLLRGHVQQLLPHLFACLARTSRFDRHRPACLEVL